MEKIYVFEVKNRNGIYGYTRQEDGGNLPKKLNNQSVIWKSFRTLEIEENEPPRIGLNTKEMLEHINNEGFYINKITIDIQISE